MPSQVSLKEKDAPVSSHEKAILSGTPSPNDMHPNSLVTTESSSYDKEYASLERIFTDMVLAKHESSGKNNTALTNEQFEAIQEYLEIKKEYDLCKDSDEKKQLFSKLREIRNGSMYHKHWRKSYSLNGNGQMVDKKQKYLLSIGDYYKTCMHYHVKSNHVLTKWSLCAEVAKSNWKIARKTACLFDKEIYCPQCSRSGGSAALESTSRIKKKKEHLVVRTWL